MCHNCVAGADWWEDLSNSRSKANPGSCILQPGWVIPLAFDPHQIQFLKIFADQVNGMWSPSPKGSCKFFPFFLNIPFTYSKSTPMIREIKQGQVVSYMRESKHLSSKSRPLSGWGNKSSAINQWIPETLQAHLYKSRWLSSSTEAFNLRKSQWVQGSPSNAAFLRVLNVIHLCSFSFCLFRQIRAIRQKHLTAPHELASH